MKIDKIPAILIYMLFSSIFGFSQNNTRSPYSLNELGEINFLGNISYISMGGVDSAIDSIEFNINNPSSLAKLKTTNYQIGTFYKSTGISNSLLNERANAANINYIAIAVPVKRFGFGFGILPYSSLGFRLQTSEEFNNENIIDTRFFGADGDINRAFVSLGIPLNKYISIGTSINYNFGKFSYEKYNQYDGINYGTYSNSTSEITGFTYSFSSNISFPLKDDISLNLLYNYNLSDYLNSYNTEFIYTSTSALINEESLGDFVDVDLANSGLENTSLLVPKKSIFSVGLEKTNKWFIGAQYENKMSSKFENKFLDIKNVSYRDSKIFSIGGYFIPDSASLNSYWKRVKYRFGIKNEEKSIIINNLPINHFSLNLGLGLPLSGLSKANLGLEFGKTSDERSSLVENYVALRIGLSLNDIWFIKRKFN